MTVKYNTDFVLSFLCAYVLLMATGKALNLDMSTFIYIFCLIIMISNTIFLLHKYKYLDKNLILFFLIIIILTVVNVLVNNLGYIELVKIIGTKMFFFIGTLSVIKKKSTSTKTKYQLLILMGAPLIIVILQMLHFIDSQSSEGLSNDFSDVGISSIFVNKNNAIFYFIALAPFLYFLDYNKKFIFLYLIFMALLFNTLGAVVALFMASAIVYFRLSLKSLVFSIFIIITLSIVVFLLAKIGSPTIERLINAYTISIQLFNTYSFSEITELNFGEVVQLTGSTDLSLFFRIIHWLDIFYYYCNAPFYNQLFGIGVDNIQNISKIKLVAHNDWLKMLVEIGFLYFITYLIFILVVLKNIAKIDRMVTLFFITILIYLFSDNLITNFLSMSLFYYFLGLIYKKSNRHFQL